MEWVKIQKIILLKSKYLKFFLDNVKIKIIVKNYKNMI